jgi:hypothetical protein
MITTKSKSFIFTLFTILILLILDTYSFPYISLNGSGGSYSGTDGETIIITDGAVNAVENYVIEGAGFFLDGYSNILSLSDTIESSQLRSTNDIDFSKDIDIAISSINSAIGSYELLVKTAESTPYNQIVIKKLLNFDYDKFAKSKSLNQVVFSDAKNYLSTGDITGLYKEILSRHFKILNFLKRARLQTSTNGIPEIELIWQLNDLASQTLMLGQYVAMVFSSL